MTNLSYFGGHAGFLAVLSEAVNAVRQCPLAELSPTKQKALVLAAQYHHDRVVNHQQLKTGPEVCMLRLSPNNEDFLLRGYALTEHGLIELALEYVRRLYGDNVGYSGRIADDKVIVTGPEYDLEFYITRVPLLEPAVA
jgi:hypothetical protein